mgnify:FL=1
MKLHASGEDYLETILVLQKKLGMVRSVDVARHMEVSKPACAMQWLPCGMAAFSQWTKITFSI